jgi:hypothetical protein
MKPVNLAAELAAAETELACLKLALAQVKEDRDELRQERDDWRREAELLCAEKADAAREAALGVNGLRLPRRAERRLIGSMAAIAPGMRRCFAVLAAPATGIDGLSADLM